MGKEILNRRQDIYSDGLPPEIVDSSDFVKKTDKATASKLGLVKIGDNVNVTSGGIISVPAASDETTGVIKLGTGLSVNEETGAVDVAVTGGMIVSTLYSEGTQNKAALPEGTDLSNYKFLAIELFSDSAYSGGVWNIIPASALNGAYGCGIASNAVQGVKFRYGVSGATTIDIGWQSTGTQKFRTVLGIN